MKRVFFGLLTLLPFCVEASSITGIRADGETKIFSLDDVMSIKVGDGPSLSVRSKSGDVDGGFSVIKFLGDLSLASDSNSDLVIKVYPNPVKCILHLVGANDETVFKIVSTTGDVVMNGVGENVNVSALAGGQYVIIVGDKSVKFIKE